MRAEMVRLVVLAVVEKKFVVEIAVDEAYGKLDAVFPVALKLDAVGVEVALTTPEPLVARIPFWILEMVRFEVLAVPKYPVPLAESAVVEANVVEKVVPLNVSTVPLVIRVPSKKLMPLVTCVVVAVPPFAIPRVPETSVASATD